MRQARNVISSVFLQLLRINYREINHRSNPKGLKIHLQLLFLSVFIFIPGQHVKAQTVGPPVRTLGYYLGAAYASSPLLADNGNQLRSARLDSARIRAGQRPLLTGNSQVQYAPSIGQFGYDQAISNGGTYLATVSASQNIFNRASMNARLQSVLIHQDSISNNSRLTKADLKKTITSGYIIAYSDLQQLTFQQRLFALLNQQEEYLKKLVRAGTYKQSDYLTFLVSRQAQEVAVIEIQNTYHNDLATLNQASGLIDTLTVRLEDPALTEAVLLPVNELPGYQKFRIDSLQIRNQRSLLAVSYRPKLNWFADAGTEASRPGMLYRSFGTSVGLNFTVPIYDGHQRRLLSRQLDLQEQTRKSYQHYFSAQYKGQVLAVKKQLSDIQLLLDRISNQQRYAQMLIDIDQKLLNSGDLKINDFLLAVSSYRNIQFSQTQQQINRMLLINQLNFWSAN